jgi:hypothetical protein
MLEIITAKTCHPNIRAYNKNKLRNKDVTINHQMGGRDAAGCLPGYREAVFLSEKFPSCTSETLKASPFEKVTGLFFATRNGLALAVSVVHFADSLLENQASGARGWPKKLAPKSAKSHDSCRSQNFFHK